MLRTCLRPQHMQCLLHFGLPAHYNSPSSKSEVVWYQGRAEEPKPFKCRKTRRAEVCVQLAIGNGAAMQRSNAFPLFLDSSCPVLVDRQQRDSKNGCFLRWSVLRRIRRLVAMHLVPSSFWLQVVVPGATSSSSLLWLLQVTLTSNCY